MGKGRTWCISFEDVARKDGDVSVKWKVQNPDGSQSEIPGTWHGYKKGDPPDKKAQRFHDQLRQPPNNRLVSVTRAGNTVCFQLKDEAPWVDINGVEIGDQSGQTFDIYDDPPDSDKNLYAHGPVEAVRFRLEGTPRTPDAEVRLGLGHVDPLARVPTHQDGKPQPVGSIIDSLLSEFNAIYAERGYAATVEGDELVIPEVPCKLGCRGGCNDEGLTYWLSMADPDSGTFSRIFEKQIVLRNAIALLNARLDFARIAPVRFANPGLTEFAPLPFAEDEPIDIGNGEHHPSETVTSCCEKCRRGECADHPVLQGQGSAQLGFRQDTTQNGFTLHRDGGGSMAEGRVTINWRVSHRFGSDQDKQISHEICTSAGYLEKSESEHIALREGWDVAFVDTLNMGNTTKGTRVTVCICVKAGDKTACFKITFTYN